MKRTAVTALLAITVAAGVACWGGGSESQTDQSTIAATISAAVAMEVAKQLQEREEPAEAEGEIEANSSGTPTRTPYRPYSDMVVPTPTVPAWMARLNADGPTERDRATGSGGDEWIRLLTALTIAKQDEKTEYVRDDWGAWWDDNADCRDTRAEVLAEESRTPVTYRDERQCIVDEGEWLDRWTGQTFTSAGELDIDHHVPLANAHRSGGATWPDHRKKAYANDTDLPDALNATYSPVNREKGADGPEEWRPPDRSSWCEYARGWIAVKTKWGLTITPSELTALTEMLQGCNR